MPQSVPDSAVLRDFLDAYATYVKDVLQPTQREVQELLVSWQIPEYWSKYKRNSSIPIPTPIRSTRSRVKRPEQVVDKIFRKPQRFPHGLVPESFRTMYDTIGVRVVVYFLSHLPLIDRELRSSKLVEIVEEIRPVAYLTPDEAKILSLDHLQQSIKESGYRSVHYYLRLKESVLPYQQRPVFELQVRTAVQDVWSSLEHHLGYKPGRSTHSAAKMQLRILSRMLGAIDENFNCLYEELSRFQQQHTYRLDDPLAPEILPAVLNEAGISCAQRDINNIIKFLYSRGVETVRDMLDLATPRRLEIIRNTYRSAVGRPPGNLEIIATLAALRGASDETDEIRRIKLQIAYRGAWDDIRQEFSDIST